MFYCGFYSVDVAVAFLNHFLTVGRHGLNVCRIKTTIKCDINVSITPPFLQGWLGLRKVHHWICLALAVQTTYTPVTTSNHLENAAMPLKKKTSPVGKLLSTPGKSVCITILWHLWSRRHDFSLGQALFVSLQCDLKDLIQVEYPSVVLS
jgi:hypothetical protein